MHVCPRCQSDRLVKNGSAPGQPKKQCKQCGHQFTRTTSRGKPLATKINAVLWYLSGMSMNRIAFLLRVSAQAVLTWIRDLAKDYYEKPAPTGRTIVLQLDEMWHYLRKKRCKLWIWKALDRDTGQLLDWGTCSKCIARINGRPMPQSFRRTNWYKVKRRRTILSGITVGSATGLAASNASRLLSPSQKRWWISLWLSSQGSGSMGTRMNSYHYLIETLSDCSPWCPIA